MTALAEAKDLQRIVKPTRQRRQHERIERASKTIADAAGDIGLPFQAETLLARLERTGGISEGQRAAGVDPARGGPTRRRWHDEPPPPGEPGCRVPAEVLAEFEQTRAAE